MLRKSLFLLFALAPTLPAAEPIKPIDIGNRRELMIDNFLIDKAQDVTLRLESPREEEIGLRFDQPWEGRFSGYCTVLKDGDDYRMYYRGRDDAGKDGEIFETTCVAVSKDGRTWTRPELGLFEVKGVKAGNVVLNTGPFTHNFSPMIDTRPGVPAAEKYKALAGTFKGGGLVAFVSPDGFHWKKMRDEHVITPKTFPAEKAPYAFDSMNVPFWSEAEQCYLCYYRVFQDRIRRIARTTSKDFLTWTPAVLMGYGDGPLEQLYTNQTHPYFRAPHLYLGIAARFMAGRQVLSEEQAKEVKVDPKYFKDCSDGVLITTRGGDQYSRMGEGFLTPAIGPENWTSRTNYPARGVVQTGPTEMSFYANLSYGQPSAHMRRYSLRLDGFAAAVAPYAGGELVTKPLTFAGKELSLNFATSAAGGVKVEIQDVAGNAIAGFALADAVETIGNEIDRVVRWKGGADVSPLVGKPVRLRFVMKDAKLYAFQFRTGKD